MIWILVSILIVILDQFSKYIVINNFDLNEKVPVINNFFYITHHVNKGAAWGILQGRILLLIIVSSIASIVMIYMLFKIEEKMFRLPISLILGGALGNLVDRILKGGVTDFFDVYIGSYDFPVFNIADSFVVIGSILLGVYILFIYKEEGFKS